MPPSSERRCGTCRWCDREGYGPLGGCRRRAPAFYPIPEWLRNEAAELGTTLTTGMWPTVWPDKDWCGDWAAREEDISPLSSLVAGAEWTSIEEARDA